MFVVLKSYLGHFRRVREDTKLSEEAQSAQRAEMERRMRLQMEQQQQQPAQGSLPSTTKPDPMAAFASPDLPIASAFAPFEGIHTYIYIVCPSPTPLFSSNETTSNKRYV